MSRPRLAHTEVRQAVEAELEAAGYTWSESVGGKHGRLLVSVNGREEAVILPGTPSDWRSMKNARAQVRRMIRKWRAEAENFGGNTASAPSQPIQEETAMDSTIETSLSIETIEVLGRNVAKVEYKGMRVVTLRQIDEAHERPDGTAKRQFNANRHRFEENLDFFDLTSDEIRTMSSNGVFPDRTARGRLFTERGYGKIVKGWNDDLSWQLHDAMQDAYFTIRGAVEQVVSDRGQEVFRHDEAILDLIVAGNQDLLAAQSRNAQDLVEHVEGGKAAVLRYLKMYVRETLDGLVNYQTDFRHATQKRDRAVFDRLGALEKSVSSLIEKAEQPLLARPFVFSDWYDIDGIYQEYFPNHVIPGKRFLSQAISKSLDAYCKKRQRGFDMQSRRIGGRNVNLWHKDSVKPWMEVVGREMIRMHLSRQRRSDPIVVAFGAKR